MIIEKNKKAKEIIFRKPNKNNKKKNNKNKAKN